MRILFIIIVKLSVGIFKVVYQEKHRCYSKIGV